MEEDDRQKEAAWTVYVSRKWVGTSMCDFCIRKCNSCDNVGVPWGESNRAKWHKCFQPGFWPETDVGHWSDNWARGTVRMNGLRRRTNPGGKVCFSPNYNP